MKDLSEELEASGWKEWKVHSFESHTRQWFKHYKTKSLCRCNMNESGLQMQVKEYVTRGHVGYEVHTCAELTNGEWPRFAMGFESVQELETAVRLILVAWEAMNEEMEK